LVLENGAEVGRYDYDRDLQRVKRKAAAEAVEYVLDDRYVLQEASGATGHAAYRRYHYGREPLAVSDGAGTTFLGTDAVGSVSDQTTPSGTVYQARQYDASGQYPGATAPAANQPKLGYTGNQYDPETGLVYARARYYDAETGVFLGRDPVDLDPEGAPYLHRFVYAATNPLLHTDPSGETLPFLAFVALAGVIGAEVDLIKQEIQKQTTSLSQVVEKVDFKEVAAVGAGSAMGAAAFAGALAATGSIAAITGSATAASGTAAGIGLGGTAAAGRSVAVAATVSGAVGGYASATLGALAKGATVREAHEQGTIAALPSAVAGLAAVPLGAVGGTAGALIMTRVAEPQVGRVVGGAMGGFAAGFGASQIVQQRSLPGRRTGGLHAIRRGRCPECGDRRGVRAQNGERPSLAARRREAAMIAPLATSPWPP
jgi:RHS repeat-associated protein